MRSRTSPSLASQPPLAGRVVQFAEQAGRDYASVLINSLGGKSFSSMPPELSEHHQRLWASSGAMWLTGESKGPPLCNPVPLAACAHGALLALSRLAPGATLPSASELLGERAAIAGLRRSGAIAAGGGCRLLACDDGALAINLPRSVDWELLPALLDNAPVTNWDSLARELSRRHVADMTDSAALLGLAVAAVAPPPSILDEISWYRIAHVGSAIPALSRAPRVVDLSALWAGPLCTHLFSLLGAEVIKVESRDRPDGARQGPGQFFDLMNAGKASVAIDLSSPVGRNQLKALVRSADIVVESSRPRGLQQMDIWAEQLIDEQPGLTWISITGYGRGDGQGNRIAYGDDAGAAAGLTAALQAVAGDRVFCSDAIADPLTGMHAALAGWASWLSGGGRLLDISLFDVVRHCTQQPQAPCLPVEGEGDDWRVVFADGLQAVARPRARSAARPARSLGADNQRILDGLKPC